MPLALLFFFSPAQARAQQSGSTLSSLREEAFGRRLWEERSWHLLLHYRRTWRGGFKSEAEGPDFFLAEKGDRDPQAELEASLSAFFDPPARDPETPHPQCRFPARYLWLKEKLRFDPSLLSEQACPELEKWKQALEAESASMIFASYYLSSAASMYGHTFLRLDKKGREEGERLLDYSVNYGAVADSKNPVLYAVRGLSGGFRGRFNSTPFYLMVQNYNNIESRDLWEYRLDLSRKELDRLVLHLWELKRARFRYYFLNKNCSYQLLPLLEAAAPRLNLTPSRPWWVIPADTLRILSNPPGLVSSVNYRPSHMSSMLERRGLLTPDETKIASKLAEGSLEKALKELELLPGPRQALVLEAAEDFLLYKVGYSQAGAEALRTRERRILVKRASLDLPSIQPERPALAVPPEKGHRTARIAMALGASGKSSYEEFSFRAALHDLLDPPGGYAPGSRLEMGHLRVRHDNREGRTYVQELTLIKTASLSPLDPWIRKPSWRLQTGLDAAEELGRPSWKSLYYGFNIGGGPAFKTSLWKREIYYALAEADAGMGGVFRENYRLGAGVRAGLLLELTKRSRAQMEGSYFGYPLGDPRPNFRASLGLSLEASRDLSFRLNLERRGPRREASAGVFKYF